jgi:hypothetical protein
MEAEMKIFNFHILTHNQYIEDSIVDGDYSFSDKDEKDFTLIKKIDTHYHGDKYTLEIYHCTKYGNKETILATMHSSGYWSCDIKFNKIFNDKELVAWHKKTTSPNYR